MGEQSRARAPARPVAARLAGAAVLALLCTTTPAAAQYSRYNVPGSLAERELRSRESVRRQSQDTRWQLGPLRLTPRLSIGDLGYIDNIYSSSDADAESDLQAKASAGLRGFLNLGPKVLVSPFADLSYSWWLEQADLRSLLGSYGLQLFGDFNRLQLQLEGGHIERQRNLSSELEVPVDLESDRVQIGLEVDLRGPLRLFALASTVQSRYLGDAAELEIPELELAALALDSERLNVGVVYELGSGLSVGLGAERTEGEFQNDPGGRSNKGSGPLVRLDVDRNRLFLNLDAALLDLEFAARESRQGREQLTGVARIGWRFSDRLSATVYGATQLDYSALEVDAVFEGRRSGLSLARSVSRRGRVRAFYEVGEDEFARVEDDRVVRVDDHSSYGLGLQVDLTRRIRLAINLVDARRDSSDPQFDRSVRSMTGRVSLGGNLLPW